MMSDDQVRILFLAANPKSMAPLELNTEFEAIEERLNESRHAKAFLLQHRWKVNRDQLLDLLLRYRPHIVHMSGHGTEDHLILQDRDCNAWPLDRKTTREVFKAAREHLHLVVLNACYSRDVAEDVSEVIDCVIGMSIPVYDSTAIQFAGALYRGIGEGLSVREAFDQARTQVGLSGLSGQKTPQILPAPDVDPRRLYPLEWVKQAAAPALVNKTAPSRPAQVAIPTDRPSLRKALIQHLTTDTHLDTFINNYFFDVFQRLSGGMDRLARINLLMTMKDPGEIAAALSKEIS